MDKPFGAHVIIIVLLPAPFYFCEQGDHASVIYGVHFPNRLFVGCLPPLANANDLGKFFGTFGKVVEAKVVLDEQRRSKRFGFVSFSKPEEAEAVLQQGTIYFQGKKINVGPAVKKDVKDSLPQVPVRIVSSTPVSPPLENEAPTRKAKYTYTFEDRSSEPKTPPRSMIEAHESTPQISACRVHQICLTPPSSPDLSCAPVSITPPGAHFSQSSLATSSQMVPVYQTSAQMVPALPAYQSNHIPQAAPFLYVPWSLDLPQQSQIYTHQQPVTYSSTLSSISPYQQHQQQQLLFMPAYVY